MLWYSGLLIAFLLFTIFKAALAYLAVKVAMMFVPPFNKQWISRSKSWDGLRVGDLGDAL